MSTCDCMVANYPWLDPHYRWEHGVRPIPYVPSGPTVRVRRPGDRRWNAEPYVTSSVIEALLQAGRDAQHMAMERQIAPGCRPDLVVEPPAGDVEVWESKAWTPSGANRRQAARYVEAARARWPERTVRVFLVWPSYPMEFPSDPTLTVEVVA